MARKLEVEVVGDTRSLERSFSKASGSASKMGKGIKAGLIGVGAALVGLGFAVKAGFGEFSEATQVAAQTNAVLKSTGGIAGITAKHVDELATSIMKKTGIDDEAIKTSENLLLGFTNLRNEAGKGNDVFDRTTKVIQDYAVRTGKNATTASVAFGKALNDPVNNMGALGRAGIKLTKGQQEIVKGFVKSGHAVKAQTFLLDLLEKRFGGAAEAAGKTLPGQLRILKETLLNSAGDIVGTFAPALIRLANFVAPKVSAALERMGGFVKKIVDAKGIQAKLNIVWTGIESAAMGITNALRRAIQGVDWVAAWGAAQGIGAGLQKRMESLDWTGVGRSIGDGIATAVGKTAEIAQKLADAISATAKTVDWTALGKAMGPGLAAALVTAFATLMDPGFWAKNWDLALSVALVAFAGPIGKLAGRLGALVVRPLAKVGGDMVLAVVGGVESLSPRVAAALLTGLSKLPGVAASALGRLTGVVGAAFTKLGGLAQFVVKVLGIQAVISAIGDLVGKVQGKFHDLLNWLRNVAPGLMAAAAIGIGAGIIGGIIAGVVANAHSIIDAVVRAISNAKDAALRFAHIKSPSLLFAEEVGKPIAQGIAMGIINNSALVANALKGVLISAVKRKDFGTVSSIISSMFAARQGQVKTPSEKAIDRIERAQNLADINQGIEDATNAVAASVAALQQAIAEGDPAAIAAAEAQLAADRRAEARARQELVLFNLREKAEAERAKLDAKQLAEQVRLSVRLERLNTLFEKKHETEGALLAAVKAMLHKLKIPGFAEGGVVPGPLGSPMLIRAHGGETVLPTHRRGAVAAAPVIHEHHYHGPVVQDNEFIRYLTDLAAKDRRRNGTAFGIG